MLIQNSVIWIKNVSGKKLSLEELLKNKNVGMIYIKQKKILQRRFFRTNKIKNHKLHKLQQRLKNYYNKKPTLSTVMVEL